MGYQLVLHILTCTYSVYCCYIFHFPRQVAKTLSIFRRSNTYNILITEATLFKQGMRATKSNRKYSLYFFFFFFLAENAAGGGGGGGEDGKSKTCIIL